MRKTGANEKLKEVGCIDCHVDINTKKKADHMTDLRMPTADVCGTCHANVEYIKKFNPQLRVDQLARYPMPLDDEEADLLAGPAHLRGDPAPPPVRAAPAAVSGSPAPAQPARRLTVILQVSRDVPARGVGQIW